MKIFNLGFGEVKLVSKDIEAAGIKCSAPLDKKYNIECKWYTLHSQELRKNTYNIPIAPENVFKTSFRDPSWLENKIISIVSDYKAEEIYWRIRPRWNVLDYFDKNSPYYALGVLIILRNI